MNYNKGMTKRIGNNDIYILIVLALVLIFIINWTINNMDSTKGFSSILIIFSIVYLYITKRKKRVNKQKSKKDEISNLRVKSGEDKGKLWIHLDKNKLDYLSSLNNDNSSLLADKALKYREKFS